MKRLYLLFLGVFVLFISLTSVSYAYTIDDVLSYSYQLKDKTSTNGGGTQAYDFLYTKLTQYWNTITNTINANASDCTYFIVGFQYAYSNYNDYSNFVYIHCFTNSPPLTHSGYLSGTTTYEKVTFSTNSNYYKGTLRIRASNGSSSWYNESTNYICADININPPKGFFLIADGDYSSYINYNINGLIVPPSYSFIPYTTENVHVTLSNNLSGDCIRLPFSPAENYKRIGNIQGWEDLDGFKMYWAPVLYVSGDETYGEAVSSYIYTKQNGGLSDGHMTFMNINDGSVYINVDSMYNRQVYVLSIDAHIGDNYFPIYLDGHDYDATFYSYFYTTDTSIPSNNTGISQQYYDSLPPSLQNFLENNSTDYNDIQKDNINYYLNQFFNGLSGDFVSGDIVGQLGYIDHTDNDFSLYIYTIYRNILDILVSSSTDSTLTFTLRGNTYTFNASDFAIPDGPLKSFVSLILTGGLLYLFYIQIHYYILNITTLDLFKALKGFEHEHTFYM